MHASSVILNFRVFLLSLIAAGQICVSEESPVFAVKFTERGVAFSGMVPSEEVGLDLASAVKAIRPDLEILNEGLKIDPDASFPPVGELKSLLAELGISTHEGGFALWDDAVLLSGLTDSRITLTALKIRLGSLLQSRRLINRLCIVPSSDLPNISVRLASGKSAGPLLDFDFYPSAVESFLPPGLLLEKLFPTMAMMSDLTRFDPASSTLDQDAGPLRAIPLLSSSSPGSEASPSAASVLRAIPTGPGNTYVELGPIRFSRSSFLLQANQKPIVADIIKQLSSGPLEGKKIALKPVRSSGGSGAFGQYLSDRRSSEVQNLLMEGGISEHLISITPVDSKSTVDEGIVQIVIEIPPPPPAEESSDPETETEEQRGSDTGDAVENSPPKEQSTRVRVGTPVR